MSKLIDAAANVTTTTNGMKAYKTTNNKCLDLFFKIGTARGQDMTEEFYAAYKENPDVALRILQWSRDVREGAGERQRFRDILSNAVGTLQDKEVSALLRNIPEIGRFDDLHIFMGTAYEDEALGVHAKHIVKGNGLAGKWAPRKGAVAAKLREILGLSPKGYRKTIVGLSNTVEQKMCANEWDEITYEHVPSVASKVYSRAFRRHDEARYNEYIEAVTNGEAKMHAGAVFPHEIYKQVRADSAQAIAQWNSLPNYLEGVDERILTVCDVSGSMSGLPMDISIGLGLYFSERLEGVFKDCVVTFSSNPSIFKLKGNLQHRVRALASMEWGMSTNLEKTFEVILSAAVENDIAQEEMPTKLLIISDMQFNQAVRGGNKSALEMMRKKFKKAGYEMPAVVFWNAAIATSNMPISKNEDGIALVSGASPAVIKSVLGAKIDPVQVMLDTVMKPRYDLL